MFGLRVLREDEYQRLLTEKDDVVRAIGVAWQEISALKDRMIESEGKKVAAQTMRDMLVTRLNVLEEECATYRNKLTGLPQIAPKIERGSPIPGNLGAQVDLFEDVGDDKARELRDSGLLHESSGDSPFMSARSMTDHLDPTPERPQ
jgi:hypothetical protein